MMTDDMDMPKEKNMGDRQTAESPLAGCWRKTRKLARIMWEDLIFIMAALLLTMAVLMTVITEEIQGLFKERRCR